MIPLVYIIDDDLVSQFATQYRLKQAIGECSLVSFDSAKEGLKGFIDQLTDGKKLPDILFLDLEMPNMDGWEFLKEFRNIHNNNIPTEIYVLSAFANAEDRKKVKNHPMVKGYFNKPLTLVDAKKIVINKQKVKLSSD
ncbi:response regulator [Arenibacter certesii]|uniref:Response regulator n=1 Tax=Arenibacter certesii TaxID=228955 RepID=A0A918IR42_9FLAO|nr:response regulator [Arenibacter certesii]GGW26416.1 response regulator [Arenibacter certesii]